MTMITPHTIAAILRQSPDEYKTMHRMNETHPMIKGIKLGAVFSRNSEYHVYVGLNGRNRRYPMIAVRVSDRARLKMTANNFARAKDGV